ncbi:helix-turn-helix domain-containing protein [Alicyclobacillus acidocaldarius]|uniref:helix-turn-helix domain-containing protein n=1 Tax=Alicyclobacillus acidocaldarius TaxID=405212 RepID=UPI000674EDBE|nr:helix-turn-helix transcriptional regulator [Alicyclobacillus acidocaldarius]
MFDVGARLRSLRMAAGLTTKQLAEAVGVHQSFISQVENNASGIKLQTLESICDFLGISLAEFFSDHSPNELPTDLLQLMRAASNLTVDQRVQLTKFLESLGSSKE